MGKNAGCTNWEDIVIDDIIYETSADTCSDACLMQSGCIGFGFQDDACDSWDKGVPQAGGCMLWKGSCHTDYNDCWNDYLLARGGSVPCEMPEVPIFTPGSRECPKNGTCLNENEDYGRFAAAWTACSVLPECAVIVKSSTGRYNLRRETDPVSAQGESLTYACNAATASSSSIATTVSTASGLFIPAVVSTTIVSTTISSTTSTSDTSTTRTLVKVIRVTEGLKTFEINHAEYEKLLDDPELYEETMAQMKQSVAEEYGVSPDAVHIELTDGSSRIIG